MQKWRVSSIISIISHVILPTKGTKDLERKSDDFEGVLYYLKGVVRTKNHEVHVSVPAENASARTGRGTSLLVLPGSAHSCVPNNVSPVQPRVEMQSYISSRLACQIHRKPVPRLNQFSSLFFFFFLKIIYKFLFNAQK